MGKIYLGAAQLPDGAVIWTFAQLHPEMVVSIHERNVLAVQRVSGIIDSAGVPRRPEPLPPDHWLRMAVTMARPCSLS